MRKSKLQKGFTIVELLIATSVFSILLVILLTSLLRISQMFYKGVNMSRTQETARNVLQYITDDLQFYKQPPVIGSNYFCIGNHRYAYQLGNQVGTSGYGILKEDMSTCKPVTGSGSQAPGPGAVELLDKGMQVNNLVVDPISGGSTSVHLFVVQYGNDNSVLISPSGYSPAWKAPDALCSGPPSSSQFCSTAEYNSTVLQSF